ncbi:MAG: PxKF domain-containing protein [Chloroflexota bacterium]|nr:PxKF domain-containing protein [Chloroflexota bacterium]
MTSKFWNDSFTVTGRGLRMLTILALLFGMLAPLVSTSTAYAAQVSSVSLKGGADTYTAADGTIYAKSGVALTLEVTTDKTTKCVELTGAHEATQTSQTAKTSWSFPLTAATGEGTQTLSINATAYRSFINNTSKNDGKCIADQNETLGTQTISYVLDNSGPVVSGSLSPAANAAGWNKGDVSITWSASDGTGSGVKSGPTPSSDSVTADTASVTKSSSATDQLGNSGSGSVTVKLDKTLPTISGSRSPAANFFGWNNSDVVVSFACADPKAANGSDGSGIKSCTAAQTLGEGKAQRVTGTATDAADNTKSATESGINVDKTAPTLSGTATTEPNGNGWYNGDVTVEWTAGDDLSGLAGDTPANSTIEGEGKGLTVSASVSDKAGNSTTADSPAVKIDRTAPSAPTFSGIEAKTYTSTSLPAESAISCAATDGLSGFDSCTFTGYSNAVGTHTLTATALDKAGNKSTSQLTYTVASPWKLKGFYAPIGESNSFVRAPGEAAPTATTSTVWNTAKGGSTIPLKFEVFIDGVESTSTADIKGFTSTKLSSCTGTITETVEELATAGSSSLRYDTTDGQFIQNWKTPTVSTDTCYRVAMTTLDGSAIYTFVKLRK